MVSLREILFCSPSWHRRASVGPQPSTVPSSPPQWPGPGWSYSAPSPLGLWPLSPDYTNTKGKCEVDPFQNVFFS